MNLHIKDADWPEIMIAMAKIDGVKLLRCCVVNQFLNVFITIEAGLHHLSVSHPNRYPNWDEIKAIRYGLLPDNKTFAIVLPPSSQYVNLHQNCFHLFEVPELHIPSVES